MSSVQYLTGQIFSSIVESVVRPTAMIGLAKLFHVGTFRGLRVFLSRFSAC